MNETVYVYIVHSDINENNIYAEFRTEAEALEYAKDHEDELTYVDRVEVALDEDGEIIEMFDSETIWVYGEDDEDDDEESEDDYWNMKAEEEEDRKWAEADLGDTTWFEDLDTDSLVETLEENEDVVECKECFELFPKEACTKIAIGYICPECGKIHSHEEPEFEIDSIPDIVIADEDTFKVDFPEIEKTHFGNGMIPDEPTPEVGPNPEPECVGPECEAPVEAPVTKEETITKLVVDEHEAIDGYEKAKVEIEANSELDKEEKEEILDTIEHIKEEEIEHIEELEELVDEVEETKVDEPVEDSELEDKLEVLVEGPLGRMLTGVGRSIVGSNPDTFWETDPKNASKPLAPHEGYYIKEVIPNANGKLETTGIVKEAKKYTEAEAIAKAESKLTDKHYLITPKGEGTKEYVYKLAIYKNGELVAKSKDWRKAAIDSKQASKLEATPKEDEKVDVEDPKPEETTTNTPKYTAAALNVTVGKATYVVVKDAELNASVNIKDYTVTADKEGIVEVIQSQKNKRWLVKGLKPGKVTLTIKKEDKEICKCEVAVKAGKLSKEDQEALDRLRGLGYELTAPVAESLNEAWELRSADITDEVETVDRVVKGTFVVIGFKDNREQTNFRGEYEYNLDTKKLKLKDVAFKFSPKHIKEIEAQLKADIEEHLDDNGKYVVLDSTEAAPGLIEPEVGESTESTPLEEHVNEEHPAIESDQELEGTDNAVVECEVADIITHSEDEKPLDCEMEKAPLEKPLTEDLSEDKLKVMEDYLKATKFASLDTEWEDEGDFYVDIIGAYLDYSTRTHVFTLGLSIYHASEDNNAEYPERHTDEEEFSYESLAEMYEDEDCKEFLDRIYVDNLAKLTKSLDEETHAQYAKPEGNRVQAYNNALKYAKKAEVPFIYGYSNHTGKFFALEQPIKVSGRPADAEKEFRSKYKNCAVVYMVYPDKTFLNEVLYNFTPEEQAEYGIDEEGQSLEGFDTFVRCNWCGEVYPEFDCKFEANLGWLCPRCQDEVRSHGGPLTIVEEPSEEQIQATLEN